MRAVDTEFNALYKSVSLKMWKTFTQKCNGKLINRLYPKSAT
jgi:hypothetical protein